MAQDKIKFEMTGIAATLLRPVWHRTQFSKKYSSVFYDARAIELFEEIDYDPVLFGRVVEGDDWLEAVRVA